MTKQAFEGCPKCGRHNRYLNAGRSHWFVCDEHRVMWCMGSNLFTIPDDETSEAQRQQWQEVATYRKIPSEARP